MAHTFFFGSGSTITAYVDGRPAARKVSVVKHQVLDANHSTLQYLGAESPETNLTFKLYGQAQRDYIEAAVTSGSVLIYTDDRGTAGSYVCSEFSADRVQALNWPDNWYNCTLKATQLLGSGSLYYNP